ncbi:hypothetical protein [Polyangium jinanense]|uniref:hypothetical protein n=1 Tax=Polyangium jinanense TaxID=2829994 RepID=UPI003559946C
MAHDPAPVRPLQGERRRDVPARGQARALALAALLVSSLSSPLAGAAEESDEALPPPSYSPYERETIKAVVAAQGKTLDESPEGKTIEAVDIVTLDVIEQRDPVPNFVNIFHATTRKYVVRREVLLEPGQPYRQELADETGRNLRNIPQFSLVLVFAVRGSKPDRVRLVVVTKDVWSLRVGMGFRIARGGFEYLLVQPSEENLFGTHHSALVQAYIQPETYALGARYSIPRVGGSRILLKAEGNVVWNRESGKPEGSFGAFQYGQPLYSTHAEWSYIAQIKWRYEIDRRYVGGRLATFDAKSTEQDDAIPFRYRADVLAGSYTLTRSFGRRTKHDISVGVEATRRVYRQDDLARYAPDAAREFVDFAVPRSDTRIGPFAQIRAYSTRFMRVLDFNTLGLQEDIRLGHDLLLRVYPVFAGIGSSRDFFGATASASYTAPMGDGIARIFAEGIVEAQPDRIADASLEAGARIQTPRTGIGRLVLDARILRRFRNYMNRRSVLGGDTRLRGYTTLAYIGSDVLTYNLEYRARPFQLFSFQLGPVAFFDAGDAFDGFDEMRIKHSVGVGVRAVFPQLDRSVMRVDWGFPLTRAFAPEGPWPGQFVVTFQQAFQMPQIPLRTTDFDF